MSEVHRLACQSRCGNNQLESLSRENCTPGSEGGTATAVPYLYPRVAQGCLREIHLNFMAPLTQGCCVFPAYTRCSRNDACKVVT